MVFSRTFVKSMFNANKIKLVMRYCGTVLTKVFFDLLAFI